MLAPGLNLRFHAHGCQAQSCLGLGRAPRMGSDLVNRTLFAASTYNTTAFGVSARLGKDWNAQMELFRNTVT